MHPTLQRRASFNSAFGLESQTSDLNLNLEDYWEKKEAEVDAPCDISNLELNEVPFNDRRA